MYNNVHLYVCIYCILDVCVMHVCVCCSSTKEKYTIQMKYLMYLNWLFILSKMILKFILYFCNSMSILYDFGPNYLNYKVLLILADTGLNCANSPYGFILMK